MFWSLLERLDFIWDTQRGRVRTRLNDANSKLVVKLCVRLSKRRWRWWDVHIENYSATANINPTILRDFKAQAWTRGGALRKGRRYLYQFAQRRHSQEMVEVVIPLKS